MVRVLASGAVSWSRQAALQARTPAQLPPAAMRWPCPAALPPRHPGPRHHGGTASPQMPLRFKFARPVCPRVDRLSPCAPGPCVQAAAAALRAGVCSLLCWGPPEVSRPAGQAVFRGGHGPHSRLLLPRHSDPFRYERRGSRDPCTALLPGSLGASSLTAPAQLCPLLPAARTPSARWPRQAAPGRSFGKDGRAGQQPRRHAASGAVSHWTLWCDGGHTAGPHPGPRAGLSASHL